MGNLTMRDVTIGDVFSPRGATSKANTNSTVIDFHIITSALTGEIVRSVVIAMNTDGVKFETAFSTVVRYKLNNQK